MGAYLEVRTGSQWERIALERERALIGSDPSNDIQVSDDAVSRIHAAIERYPAGWCIRDLGSTNGTHVNGSRIWGEYRLRNGDEIRVGTTLLSYGDSTKWPVTKTTGEGPELTRRERDVLVELCRPILHGEVFARPSTVREIAEALVVTENAVKQHLLRLSAKFSVAGRGEERRFALANEAMRAGAVSLADLRSRAP